MELLSGQRALGLRSPERTAIKDMYFVVRSEHGIVPFLLSLICSEQISLCSVPMFDIRFRSNLALFRPHLLIRSPH